MVLIGKVFMGYLQMPAISTDVVIPRVQTVTPIVIGNTANNQLISFTKTIMSGFHPRR